MKAYLATWRKFVQHTGQGHEQMKTEIKEEKLLGPVKYSLNGDPSARNYWAPTHPRIPFAVQQRIMIVSGIQDGKRRQSRERSSLSPAPLSLSLSLSLKVRVDERSIRSDRNERCSERETG